MRTDIRMLNTVYKCSLNMDGY